MQFIAQALVLSSALALTSTAADVWTNFYDQKGTWLNTTSYRIGDTGCFSVINAVQVAFHQFSYKPKAHGPYTLLAFNQSNCAEVSDQGDAQQTFKDVSIIKFSGDKKPNLEEGVRGAAVYKWKKPT